MSRHDRVARLREMMDRADVAVSEKFSQVLRAFQIENEYGRTMEAYGDTINVDGVDRKVDVLKVGRVAWVFQTPDGEGDRHVEQGRRSVGGDRRRVHHAGSQRHPHGAQANCPWTCSLSPSPDRRPNR